MTVAGAPDAPGQPDRAGRRWFGRGGGRRPAPVIRRTLAVAGVQRSYLLAAPPPGVQPVGIVLCLHGSMSVASRQRGLTRMDRLAVDGAVVAFPQAIRPLGRGFAWDHAVDLPYLVALLASLTAEFGPKVSRACLSGMSGGARQSCQLAWERPDLVGAVGAVAGVRSGVPPGPGMPVPVVAFHGTDDRINPYAGGHDARWDISVPEAVTNWARANQVADRPTEESVTPTLARWTFGDVGGPGEVTLWTSQGAGHTWPGGYLPLIARGVLGRTSTEIDATDTIWRFYRQHQPGG